VEDLPVEAFIGDDGLTVEEPAPFGTILAILPVTNPTSTVINNAISMVAAATRCSSRPILGQAHVVRDDRPLEPGH